MNKFNEIPLPFAVVDKLPVDKNTICQTLEQAQQRAYDGYSCYVKDLKLFLQFIEIDGVLQIKQGSTYEHPTSHPASMITEEADKRFLTDAERIKLTEIAANANNYTHPVNHPASIITEETNKRFLTDAEQTKLSGIETSANNYTHPANHPANIITQDANNRLVSDTEKSTWNDKYSKNEVDNKFTALTEEIDWKEAVQNFVDIATAYPTPQHGWSVYVKTENKKYTYNGTEWVNTSSGEVPMATNSVDGLMSSSDKSKLDGVAANANNYTHPANHPASIITEETNKRFLTDAERSKLSGIAANANNYTHPANHPASIITQDANNRFVSDTEKSTWNGKANGNHTHTDYVAKSGDSMTGILTVTKAGAEPTIKGSNTYINTAGMAGVMGETPSAGIGYLGVFINGIRAGVMGLIGSYSTGTTNWAAYFEGRTKINGKLAVGDINPSYQVDVVGDVHVTGNMFADSDKRLKKSIRPIKNALTIINKLQGVRFNWRKSNKASIGVIAQDVEKLIPEIVSTNSEGFKSVDYSLLTAVLIQAINEQQKQINELREML